MTTIDLAQSMFCVMLPHIMSIQPMINYRNFKVGGIRFMKLGRLNVSFSISK